MMVRLQKYLAECGVASRRNSEKLIVEGKVRVNGLTVTELGTKVDPEKDQVAVGKKIVRPDVKGIALFYKPKGVVSTLDDPEGRRAISDYLTREYQSYFPVGRLDFESTGLIILTNDGELAERLFHPRYQIPRVYHVKVRGRVSQATLEKLTRGVTLADGPARGLATLIEQDDKTSWVEITVYEGRNRLVRRLMDRVEHPVIKLQRVSHGPFKITDMKPGELRKLKPRDYDYLRAKVFNFEPALEGAPLPSKKSTPTRRVRREVIIEGE